MNKHDILMATGFTIEWTSFFLGGFFWNYKNYIVSTLFLIFGFSLATIVGMAIKKEGYNTRLKEVKKDGKNNC